MADEVKEPTPVDTPRPDYDRAFPRWQMVRDVCQGAWRIKERSMNSGLLNQTSADSIFGPMRYRSGYLPFLNPTDRSEENIARNIQYQQRAVFYGVTGHTRDALVGLAFRKDPIFVAPKGAEYLESDCNENGVSIYQQSQHVLDGILEAGRGGLYVDFHTGDTRADDRVAIHAYEPEDIINWRMARIGGRMILTMVVLREWVDIPDGFGTAHIERYRELALDSTGSFYSTTWEKDGATYNAIETIYPVDGSGKQWDEIPFSFIGSRSNSPAIDDAPLFDLAELNLAHYRNSADYEDSVFYCGQAQAYITGVGFQWLEDAKKNGVYIGSRTPLVIPENGTFGFASASANSLVADAMDDKEQQMVALGARLLQPGRGNTATATEVAGDREATTSVLALCVSNVSEAYGRALKWCERYIGLQTDVASYVIDKEFTVAAADPAVMQAFLQAVTGKVVGPQDMRDWMRKVGLIAREDADIQADIDAYSADQAAQTGDGGSGYPAGQTAAAVADSGAAQASVASTTV